MSNVKKHRNLVPDNLYEKLLKDIRFLHYSKDENEFSREFAKFKKAWNKGQTANFFSYFQKQWVNIDGNESANSRHYKWRIFDKPPGFAISNSPIESFNRTIKRDFCMRKRFSVIGTIGLIRRIIKVYR